MPWSYLVYNYMIYGKEITKGNKAKVSTMLAIVTLLQKAMTSNFRKKKNLMLLITNLSSTVIVNTTS